jgi:NADH:ubiquinone oxidoreductase subunit 3 (subunit A)
VPVIIGLGSLLIRSKFMRMEGFECGFDSFNVRVFPVSLRFFIFCIVFLILDLELIIISVTPFVIWSRGFIVNIVIFLFLVTLRIIIE